MNNDSHVRLGIPVCLAILSAAAMLSGSGGRQASGQANLVRVVCCDCYPKCGGLQKPHK